MMVQKAMAILKEDTTGNVWVRPNFWKGAGSAISRNRAGDYLLVVPSRGEYPWHPTTKDLISEWGVVKPNEVIAELDKILKRS